MSNRTTTFFYAGMIAVAFTAIGMVIASRLDLAPSSAAQAMLAPTANSAPVTGPLDAQTFRNIAKKATPSVVNIRTQSRQRAQEMSDFFGGDDLLKRFFGQPDDRRPKEQITQGAGSGFIIDKSGLILTNNHVIDNATKIEVGFFGQENELYDARVIGRDALTDSALLELTEKPGFDLTEIRFGDSAQMEPGDWVMAIGNPFNLSHTVTVGVVSAKERPFPVADGRWQDVLQTDAAINPGNSGGPLLNVRGEVVGVNTAIYATQQMSNLGIGFAIPINAVRELLPELRTGKVTRGRVGLQLDTQRLSAQAADALGVPDRNGALVRAVDDTGPAAKAGVKPGDVVVEFNGKPVLDSDELVNQVVRTKPGTSVQIKIIRDKQPKTLSVTVEELDVSAERQDARAGDEGTAGFGMTLENVTPQVARQMRLPSGMAGAIVVDVEPSGPAFRGGVQAGDVILEVNRQSVDSAQSAVRQLQLVESGQPTFLLVWRQGSEVFLTVNKQ